ncbi:MAG TPA: hypothetical protein VF060_04245 [Trebonia sp.]
MTAAGERSGDGAARDADEARVEETMVADAQSPADHTEVEAEAAERPGTWRGRLLWSGGTVAAAVGLFIGLLAISWTYWVNSDGSGIAMQGWDMLHGNLLLSGWWTSDVSFYTFEVPIDAIVESFHGLNAGVVHITAAIAYTLLVCVAALLARGKSRGGAGVAAALIAGGILLAPGDVVSTGILLGSPDHIGVGVPILLTFLVVDRLRERWWVPLVVCVLLLWAQLDDPTAEFAAAFALAVVCLVRVCLGLLRSTGRLVGAGNRAWLYDAGLGVAAVVSYGLTRLAVHLIRSAGGFSMRQIQQATQVQPLSQWPHQMSNTWHNALILFGADYWDQHGTLQTTISAVHVIGAALALIGVLAGIVSLVRRDGDRITQTLTIGTLVTLVAGAFVTPMAQGYDAHEIAVVLPLSAVLAGRTIGPWLMRRRMTRLALIPAGGALLAAYMAFFGYYATQPSVPARTQTLDRWLVAHHLTNGLGRYWTGSSTRLDTGGAVQISPVDPNPQRPYPWITKPSWYNPNEHTANFVVAGTDPSAGLVFSESAVVKAYGKPAREYRFDGFIIMVYNQNLLRQVYKPVQPNPDTGSFHL